MILKSALQHISRPNVCAQMSRAQMSGFGVISARKGQPIFAAKFPEIAETKPADLCMQR